MDRSGIHSGCAVIPTGRMVKASSTFRHGLGDILGMALRGEITPAEAQAMADQRVAPEPQNPEAV